MVILFLALAGRSDPNGHFRPFFEDFRCPKCMKYLTYRYVGLIGTHGKFTTDVCKFSAHLSATSAVLLFG